MNITVPIYEVKARGGGITWHVVGCGPYGAARSGGHPGKVRAWLVRALQEQLQKIEPAAMPWLEFHPGMKLERVKLDMKLGGAHTFHVYGTFPLIVETRYPSPDHPITIAYHPLRQQDWFMVAPRPVLDRQAEVFFKDRWEGQTGEVIAQLKEPHHCRLHAISLTIRPKTLLDALKKDEAPKTKIGPVEKPHGALKVLPEIGDNLTQRAAHDDLPGERPREPYRARLNQQLRGEGRRALVVVGPSGVGKTSVVHRFVRDMLDADGYSEHRNLSRCREVWSITGRRIIAGMSYAGQWEARCLDLLDDLQRRPVTLYVRDIQSWSCIGQSVTSERCLADFFRGPIARGEVPILAEATPEAWQRLEIEAPAFANLFTVVEVREPSTAETLGIVMHRVRAIEDARPVVFEPLALRTILELGDALFATRAFPGKALELLDALAGQVHAGDDVRSFGPDDVFAAASQRTGMPRDVLQDQRALRAEELRRDFERYVMGQREAVDAVIDVVLRIKSGLTDPRRPYDVMLFCGPTGTGKTELAKCLAAYLYGGSERLVRFDMSEFADPSAAARLVGSRLHPDGLLTSAVRRQPFCAVLLDEIEKAHPTILNLLLQVFDEGRLTDASGRAADFSHTVIVMTSNLGATSTQPVGFGGDASAVVHDMKAAVEEFFAPELFNRIDHIVGFGPLSVDVAQCIAQKELNRLLTRHGLLERRIYARATPAVLERIVAEGFDRRDGARSLKRILDRRVGHLMAEEIATGGRAHMRMFHVYQDAEDVRLHGEALREAPPVGESSLATMLEASEAELRQMLAASRDRVDGMLDSDQVERASETLRAHLAAFNAGKTGVADQIYVIDAMREALTAYRDAIDRLLGAEVWSVAEVRQLELLDGAELKGEGVRTTPIYLKVFERRAMPAAPHPPSHDEALRLLAEGAHLLDAIDGVEQLWRHGATISLSVIGEAGEREFFGAEREGLLGWFARSIATGRGALEGCAALIDEEVVEGDLDDLLPKHPTEIVLSVVGLSIYDWYRGDHGCHVREALGSTSEVVRVEVRPEAEPCGEALRQRVATRRAFVEALDAGAQVPDNPDALLPVVRQLRWEPAPRGASRADIEDYRMGWAASMTARSFTQIAHRLRAMSRAVTPMDDEEVS